LLSLFWRLAYLPWSIPRFRFGCRPLGPWHSYHTPPPATDRPLAYGVMFLRLGGGLGCFSPAIDNYIDKRHCVWPHKRLLHPRLYLEQLAMAA
jgi:hypothetical protein